MDLDEVLTRYVGQFGRSQRALLVIIATGSLFSCMHSMSSNFLAASPNHWCSTAIKTFTNCTHKEQMHFAIPKDHDASQFSKCEMFMRNYTGLTTSDVCPKGGNVSLECNTTSCSSWDYDTSQYEYTIVTEWDLVCDHSSLAANVAGVFMLGRVIGSLFAGQLADLCGRRRVALTAGIIQVLLGCGAAFAPTYFLYLLLRFLLAIFLTAKSIVFYVLAMEYMGVSKRVIAGSCYMFFWAAGTTVLSGMAYLIRDWRLLQLCISFPEMIIYIILCIVMPESPRWLLVQGKQAQAHQVLASLARVNNNKLPEDLQITVQVEKNNTTILDLFRTPWVSFLTLSLFITWFSGSFVYYGISLNAGNMAGNPYINNIISGLVEIPAYLLIMLVMSRFNRIVPYCVLTVASSVALFLIIPVPTGDYQAVTTVLAMIGKFFVSASFGMAWIYTIEAYPTSIRSIALSTVNLGARVGSICGAYVVLLASFHPRLPLLVFGGVSLVAGLLVLTMPETNGMFMMQTVEEGQIFVKTNLCGLCCNRKTEDTGKSGHKNPDIQISVPEVSTYM